MLEIKPEKQEEFAKWARETINKALYSPYIPHIVAIADETCVKINAAAEQIKDDSMPYKAQYILEEVIKVLQSRV